MKADMADVFATRSRASTGRLLLFHFSKPNTERIKSQNKHFSCVESALCRTWNDPSEEKQGSGAEPLPGARVEG